LNAGSNRCPHLLCVKNSFDINAYLIITPEILTLSPVAGLRMTRFLGYSLFVLPQDILVIIVGNALERSACDDTAGSIPTNGMVKTIPYRKL